MKQGEDHLVSNRATVVLGTSNRHKVDEFSLLLRGLDLRLETPGELGLQEEPQESGSTSADIARSKAVWYARRLGHWVLADDTVLLVDALGGAPGIHTARYAGPSATAEENRRLLIEQLGDTPLWRRTARFVCHLVLVDPKGAVQAGTTGRCCGRIIYRPRGPTDFGYDCLFELIEYRRTLAQLGPVAKAVLSHRGRAVRQMLPEIALLPFS